MFGLLKKLKEKREEEKSEQEEKEKEEALQHRQSGRNHIYKGMYCPTCGYMTVNENSNELPLEGFALCPNCGDHLKNGWFIKNEDGFSLTENNKAAASLQEERPKQSEVSGGHYRVRKAGPNRGRLNGHFTY